MDADFWKKLAYFFAFSEQKYLNSAKQEGDKSTFFENCVPAFNCTYLSSKALSTVKTS